MQTAREATVSRLDTFVSTVHKSENLPVKHHSTLTLRGKEIGMPKAVSAVLTVPSAVVPSIRNPDPGSFGLLLYRRKDYFRSTQ